MGCQLSLKGNRYHIRSIMILGDVVPYRLRSPGTVGLDVLERDI